MWKLNNNVKMVVIVKSCCYHLFCNYSFSPNGVSNTEKTFIDMMELATLLHSAYNLNK
ncbi:hypothetical protein CSCA_3388 [Clostridium scatologenes]|uniref:Uncharacterized protein n=1 Tax=Clostridium scatologenes TaxID=1548 RepID=A0A0E3MAE3_CLOSL|nr:hypothetical protein CSCA_3388 [Clostridium scatologenes]